MIAPRAAVAAVYTVTGVVKNEGGQGIANADLDFIEYCSENNVFILNDKTLSDGSYSIMVNEGTYDIRYTPATGSTLAAAERLRVSIHANLNLSVTVLHPGIKVAGTVEGQSGTGLQNISLEFIDVASGKKIFVSNAATDATGKYSVRVVPGTYNIEYRPPSTTTYLTGLRTGLIVSADVTGLLDILGTGQRVYGSIVDSSGNPILNADLDFYDTCTGTTIPTAHDNSDAMGNFSVYVPAATYTIYFRPPRCTSLGSARMPSFAISGATNLGDVTLPDSFPLTGRVLDPSNQPVPNVDLNVYDADATGARVATSRDNTDATGNFSVYLPSGVYNINFNPPSGMALLVRRYGPVSVTGATAVGDIQLSPGLSVSGTVLGSDSNGALNVDIDVVNSATGSSVQITHDQSAPNGTFTVVVPAGTYDFRYTPPLCSPLAPADQRNVMVSAPMTLPTVHLVQGVHARGYVLDTGGSPVDIVDLDFFPPGTRNQTFSATGRDNTNSAGFYDVLVPPGTYDIDYTPSSGSNLRAAQRFGVSLLADTTIPNTILHQGVLFSGFVYANATGLPVANANLTFYPPAGGTPLFTPRNNTASNGSYSVLIDTGTWDIFYDPPTGSGLAPRWRRGVTVSTDITLPNTLLLPLTVPTVTSISPGSGTTIGGQSVTVIGSGFQPDATLKLGGVSARNVSVSGNTITASTPPHPTGLADVFVTNPGNQVGSLQSAYAFTQAPVPVRLVVTRSGSDIVLSWISTDQASYTVFRNSAPTGWSDSSVLITTTATTYRDVGGATSSGIRFYDVD